MRQSTPLCSCAWPGWAHLGSGVCFQGHCLEETVPPGCGVQVERMKSVQDTVSHVGLWEKLV